MAPFTITISGNRTPFIKNYWLISFLMLFVSLWIITFIGTTDRSNWVLENTLTFIFVGLLTFTYKKYHFSDLSYLLIFLFLCLHVYGSQYTYAENPIGYWLKDVFHTERNHYDRIVHFSFGFLLAYPMREFFLKWLRFPAWVAWLLPIEISMSLGAGYELVEWAVADIFFKEQGDAYLGTQGDVWDAQKDIFLAFLGAIIATSLVSLIRKMSGIETTGEE